MSGLVAATIIAGVLLIVMGVMRLGTLIRFVPHTITTGFTAGIAVTIVIGQLNDFMGLAYPAGTAPIESMDKLACVVQNLGTLNVQALAVGLACLVVLVLWPRVTERVPASLVAVLAGIALVSSLNLNVNTIGDLYSIQGGAPRFAMPQLSLDLLRQQLPNGFTIAGMVHAVVLLAVLVLLMPYATLIPMPCIAAILLQVAYNMSGWRNVVHICRTASRGAIAVLLTTLVLTIVFDLVTAIGAGMVVTIVLFMKMVSQEAEVRGWRYYCDEDSEVTHLRELPRAVRVYEINGPMFFGMSDQLNDISVKDFTRVLIIRMRGVPSLDSSAMHALEDLLDMCRERGVQLAISHPNDQSMRTMERVGFVDQVGRENFLPNIDAAIARAAVLVDEK